MRLFACIALLLSSLAGGQLCWQCGHVAATQDLHEHDEGCESAHASGSETHAAVRHTHVVVGLDSAVSAARISLTSALPAPSQIESVLVRGRLNQFALQILPINAMRTSRSAVLLI